MRPDAHLTCRLCGQDHRPIDLAPGEKALCTRCDAVLATGKRFGPDTALVFSVTGLILALPAAFLPFISAGKLGDERVSHLFTGVESFWGNEMQWVAVLIFLCGGLLPVALLAALAVLHAPAFFGWQPVAIRLLSRSAHLLEHWAFPEVQVLAVLVALMKLGSLVDVTIGPGFWFYSAMSLCLLVAQHSFDFEPLPPVQSTAGARAETSAP
jgi:paraquat-inducible protein A